MPLMDKLRSEEIDLPLTRIGSERDGGYVVLDKDYQDSFLVSGGISNDNNFEIALASRGAKAHQIDYSISSPPIPHSSLTFSPQRLVGEESKELHFDITLDEVVASNHHSGKSELLLKLDIEGSEWEILETCNSLTKFSQIFLELHYLNRLADPDYAEKSMKALGRLLDAFFPVFIAGNNCCGIINLGGFVVPRVMEITLLNRNNYEHFQSKNKNINNRYRSQNYPERAPLVLKNW
jgi:hypothetical protein